MSKREGELKSLFAAELKRQAPGFQILQYATNGAPDRSIAGMGVQSNWEAKHATPDFLSPGDQELVCCRLAAAAHCRYIVWMEHNGVMKTMIVHPKDVIRREPTSANHDARKLIAETFCVGFDMRWLVNEVRRVHQR